MDTVRRLAIFDNDDLSGGLLPVRGHLRKGSPKDKNGRMGKDLTFFRFDTDDPRLAAKFNEIYADQINQFGGAREIEFIVYGSSVEDVYRPCKELRTKNKLIHRCNGRECYLWRKPDGTYSTETVPCPGGCKYKIKMPILMTALKEAIAINVHSTSFWDSVNLYQNLTAIHAMFGTLMGVKMILRRELKSIQKPIIKDGKRTGETFLSQDWLLTITAHPESFEKRLMQLQESAGRALMPAVSQLAITDGGVADSSEWADDEYDEAEAMCDTETARAIESLWPQFGRNERNEAEPLIDYLKRRKQINSLAELPQASAQALLEGLQKRKIQAEEVEAKKPKAASKYPCGDELARQVIDAEARLVALGEPEAGIRSEWTAHAGTLHTIETCDTPTAETWLEILKGWIASLESKR